MARLINADALLERMEKAEKEAGLSHKGAESENAFNAGLHFARIMIQGMPTVTAGEELNDDGVH